MDGQPLTLEQLINDATDINNFRSNGAQSLAVANCVNRTMNGVPTAIRLLTLKLRTRKEIIMLQTLNVIEVCAKKCGSKFHKEIGKFRFLNEFIVLLSKKYEGDTTPENVKERIIDIMYTWYVNLPNESKIHEVYKVLKHEGVITSDPVNNQKKAKATDASSIRADDTGGVNEAAATPFEDKDKSELLKHLLSSGDAEDLDSANQLIKTMVREEEERLDGVAKKYEVLELVKNNVLLLNEMLASYNAETAGDSVDIINELHEKCLSLRPELFRLASSNIDDDNETVAEILTASDDLTQVIELYKDVVILNKTVGAMSSANEPERSTLSVHSSSPITMDAVADIPSAEGLSNTDINEQLKSLELSSNNGSGPDDFTSMQSEWTSDSDELLMFSPSCANASSASLHTALNPAYGINPNAFVRPGTVNPIMLNNRTEVQIPNLPTTDNPPAISAPPKDDVLDFDVFSSDFFKSRIASENVEVATEAVDDEGGLNQATAAVSSKQGDIAVSTINASTADSAVSDETSDSSSNHGDLSQSPNESQHVTAKVETSDDIDLKIVKSEHIPDTQHNQTGANDYFVPMDALKTDEHTPIPVLDKDGLKTFLIIGEDTRKEANPKVKVLVLSTISLNMQPLTNFTVQVACPRAMCVKLQNPTSTELKPFNPLLSPPTLSQILLITNPSGEMIKLRFKVCYELGGVDHVETVDIDNLPIS